jgi:hypothetical protein
LGRDGDWQRGNRGQFSLCAEMLAASLPSGPRPPLSGEIMGSLTANCFSSPEGFPYHVISSPVISFKSLSGVGKILNKNEVKINHIVAKKINANLLINILVLYQQSSV